MARRRFVPLLEREANRHPEEAGRHLLVAVESLRREEAVNRLKVVAEDRSHPLLTTGAARRHPPLAEREDRPERRHQ